MTNTNIKNIINEVNTNKDIKWSIAHNSNGLITLTNSYDTSVNFSIKVAECDGDEYILVIDNHMRSTVAGYLPEYDYSNIEEGLALGIKAAVKYFNHVY